MIDHSALRRSYLSYLGNQIDFQPASDQAILVDGPSDLFGKPTFACLEQLDDGILVSDDGLTLFRINPLFDDQDLIEQSLALIEQSGFDYDEQSGTIYLIVSKDEVNEVLFDLLQLETFISYLV